MSFVHCLPLIFSFLCWCNGGVIQTRDPRSTGISLFLCFCLAFFLSFCLSFFLSFFLYVSFFLSSEERKTVNICHSRNILRKISKYVMRMPYSDSSLFLSF